MLSYEILEPLSACHSWVLLTALHLYAHATVPLALPVQRCTTAELAATFLVQIYRLSLAIPCPPASTCRDFLVRRKGQGLFVGSLHSHGLSLESIMWCSEMQDAFRTDVGKDIECMISDSDQPQLTLPNWNLRCFIVWKASTSFPDSTSIEMGTARRSNGSLRYL